ncbi:MAG: pitrilysin family protein [Bryobacterales bacterium]
MKVLPMLFCLALLAGLGRADGPATLTLPSESPLVSFRILFKTGAASDPKGKEGVAALTAAMLSEGGSAQMSYDEIVKKFFPMAASVNAQVDKEMIVFHGTAHVETLDEYYGILRQMLLEPGWREDDFRRLKDESLNFLRTELRGNNEEELGKEALYINIYKDHPYGHQNSGTIAALEALTLDDIKQFYAANFTQGNLVVGLAGKYPDGFAAKVTADFGVLPEEAPAVAELPAPTPAKKLRVQILEKDTRSTLISLGFPIDVTRGSPDWPALKLVQSYFGQHRSSKSHLYQQIREIRGMNYGDYCYIEYFPRGMFLTEPEPNLGRRQQIFQIWIRPVEPQNGMFALRIALYELDKLVKQGMSQEDFDSTRNFLSKFVNLLTQTQSDQLGYALDSEYYGTPEFTAYLKDSLKKLTLEQVNEAIRKHLRSTNLDVVIITKDAQGMRKAIQSGAPSQVHYASAPPEGILQEDKIIGKYKLDVGSLEVVPAESIFEK